MRVVVDFIEGEGVLWSIVNDGVMGGRSTSKISLTDERTALFTGFVSLENNGGFASTRAAFQSLDLSAYEGVTLRVKGDGRRYQLRFRQNGCGVRGGVQNDSWRVDRGRSAFRDISSDLPGLCAQGKWATRPSPYSTNGYSHW